MTTSTQKTWTFEAIKAIYTQPFHDLLFKAHSTHREFHDPNAIEAAQLLSIKTGSCPEDCGYCSQSAHYKTAIQKEKLMNLDDVLEHARTAKANGAKRFCMGAAWRCPPEKAMPQLQAMIAEVKALGLETCMTLGMLSEEQASALQEAGLDFYNHNIDTSPSYYEKVITTRTFDDRLQTLENVRKAGIQVCCGGILGLGETQDDRIEFLMSLAHMQPPPESIPINRLMPMEGTPLSDVKQVEGFEIVRTIATARIIMPQSTIRLTAGRSEMSDELQALCFFAGANSIFIGEKLLTGDNPRYEKDKQLFHALGLSVF